MLDKWFIEDIEKGLKNSGRFVIVDPAKRCGFLIDLLKPIPAWKIFEVHTEIDELLVKYTIEKQHQGESVIVYSTRKLENLTFIREYCATGGCLNIEYLHRYIKEKVDDNFHFDLVATEDEIIAIGKLSIGKKKEYWDRIKAKGGMGVFLPDDLLKFLMIPIDFISRQSKEEALLFLSFLNQFCDHPLQNTPPQTIANEFARCVFDNLIYSKNESFLDRVYGQWIDSKTYQTVLNDYLKNYSMPQDFDYWKMPSRHPFKEIDLKWLDELIEHFNDRLWIDSKLYLFDERANACQKRFGESIWWRDICDLLIFDMRGVEQIINLSDAIKFYTDEFYKIDTALRHLYTFFLSEKRIIQPIQEYYDKLLSVFLDKWFIYFSSEYSENQMGLLSRIISDIDSPIAVIVGDAISFEVGKEITSKLSREIEVDPALIRTNYPSETDHNMSAMFGSEFILATREERQKCLLPGKWEIEYLDLDDLSMGHKPKEISIIYADDIDQLSEKKNQGALKYYSQYIDKLVEKIDLMFDLGYQKVILTSDHGFVLTGYLPESDKIDFDAPESEKHERYYLSKTKIKTVPNWILEIQQEYKGFSFQYYSKTIKPFKTKGAYGFSHGGISPQELLVPLFTFKKKSPQYALKVGILNKDDLKSVVGLSFEVKLQAETVLFDIQRKVIITLIKNKQESSKSDIITISQGETVRREFQLDDTDGCEINIQDAISKETLDRCAVKVNRARDLGKLGGLK